MNSALAVGAASALPAAALASNSGSRSEGSSAAEGAKPNYRFINLNAILGGWETAKKEATRWNEEFRGRTEALERKASELDKKREEAKQAAKQGQKDEVKRLNGEVARGVAMLQVEQEELKREREEKRLRILIWEYQQIQQAVATWAAANGIDCVFTIDEEEQGDEDIVGRYERALRRQVLWFHKDLDATAEILKSLK
ncbi:MAG: OmpH family outer membrane protein [Planctomycetes bacterium]|nr:OmpH family outer membrane protein [Planctomycetota bacterium]